jgi:hypothetical protein
MKQIICTQKRNTIRFKSGDWKNSKNQSLQRNGSELHFFYATGEYLLNAKTLKDLVVDGDERLVLWQSLRERAENAQLYKTDLPQADIPPEVLIALLGIKDLEGSTVKSKKTSGVC